MATDRRRGRSFHEVVHDDRTLAVLGPLFKQMNRQMLLLWRLGFGRMAEAWPAGMGRILVLEHLGRSSGRRYLTPLDFTRDGGSLYCVAAFGASADWYRNVVAAGTASVFLPNGCFDVHVVDVSSSDRRIGLIRSVLKDSGFATYLAGIDPRKMSDDELAGATSSYQLIRFDPIAASGERLDDLKWVWGPVVVSLLLSAWWLGRERRN